MTSLITDAHEVAHRIKQPTRNWPGNCSAVAAQCYLHGLVPRRSLVCYGLYHGSIHPDSIFAGRGVCHHGWVELPDGRIYDPTRWTFTCEQPYVWISLSGRHPNYDLGGASQWKHIPAPSVTSPAMHKLRKSQVARLSRFFRLVQPDGLDRNQWHWLAHRHPDELQGDARWIYQLMQKLGLQAMIPIDFKRYVFRINPTASEVNQGA